MKSKIIELRVNIDGLSQLVKELKPIYVPGKRRESTPELYTINSDELNKSYDSLILAKSWLGKVLGELGEETPYKNDGKRKDVKDIEETADVSEKIDFTNKGEGNSLWGSLSHIEKVDWLRDEIKKVVNIVDPYNDYEDNLIWKGFTTKGMSFIFNTYRHLSEARFWLGFELGRIRDDNK